MRRVVRFALWVLVLGAWAEVAMDAERAVARPALRVTVVYNNVPQASGLTTGWGFAAVVESGGHRLLFDTGGDGPTLLGNLERLGIEPASIGTVVLSHAHGDHTGGLDDFLARQHDVTVWMPRSFPAELRRGAERRGARVRLVGKAQCLLGAVHTTGEMGRELKEQALVVETPSGLVVMTGCAHPGVVGMAQAARERHRKPIHLLMGGFHLRADDGRVLQDKLRALRELGVRKVAPSHCTGDEAVRLFRERWGSDFVEGGLGAVIEVP